MDKMVETAFPEVAEAAGATARPRHANAERLLNGPIGATLWRLSVPNTIGFLVGSGVTVAEMWIVGRLGTSSLAALALGYPMFILMVMVSAGAVGGAMAAAVVRAIGAGHARRAEALVWHALVISLAAGVLFSLVFLIFGPAFYAALGGGHPIL